MEDKNKKFYITTTLPYVNADPHIGFALEIIQADVIARYQRLLGKEVFFNTGTDEHGLKIYRRAKEEGLDPQTYCDIYAKKFDNLKTALNLSYNSFIRTTDEHHIKAAQEFWKRCEKSGDIYKKNYKIKYCVGCELEKTESELEEGRCPIHPSQQLEIIEEENYFFRYSKYQDKLLELYEKNPKFILPESRLNEIKEFTKRGLEDFSISRLKSKMPWGIEVPGDKEHVFYVWFDALINYISCLGWPDDTEKFNSFWPGVQVAGKDNLRQQSSMWQAMLMSAGLPTSKQILIHGFITSEGKKMSKSLGNVVDPFDLVEKYGTDAVRYFLLREISPFEDGDFSYKKFEDRYNYDLANGLGNLLSRTIALLKKSDNISSKLSLFNKEKTDSEYKTLMDNYQFNRALELIWKLIAQLDKYIDKEKPWTKQGEELNNTLAELYGGLEYIAQLLFPFLPQTSEKIKLQLKEKNKEPLFPRLSS